jgi:hypothetical protein
MGNAIVAVIFAPGTAQGAVQDRAGSGATPFCGGNYTSTNYLDSAAGINNSAVDPTPGATTSFTQGLDGDTFNDRLIYVTADEIFSALERRKDFYGPVTSGVPIIRSMLQTAAQCIAEKSLPGNKLAWATDMNTTNFVSLGSFDASASYTSTVNVLFGHVPIGSIYLPHTTNCDALQANSWWQDWQDQFFYALAKGQSPNSPVGDCTDDGSCLTVTVVPATGSTVTHTDIAGIVLFGGKKLAFQNRSESLLSPTPTNWLNRANYLEGVNATTYPGPTGGNFLIHENPQDVVVNDLAYCIKSDLTVFDCH